MRAVCLLALLSCAAADPYFQYGYYSFWPEEDGGPSQQQQKDEINEYRTVKVPALIAKLAEVRATTGLAEKAFIRSEVLRYYFSDAHLTPDRYTVELPDDVIAKFGELDQVDVDGLDEEMTNIYLYAYEQNYIHLNMGIYKIREKFNECGDCDIGVFDGDYSDDKRDQYRDQIQTLRYKVLAEKFVEYNEMLLRCPQVIRDQYELREAMKGLAGMAHYNLATMHPYFIFRIAHAYESLNTMRERNWKSAEKACPR